MHFPPDKQYSVGQDRDSGVDRPSTSFTLKKMIKYNRSYRRAAQGARLAITIKAEK